MQNFLSELLPVAAMLAVLIGTPWLIINAFRQSILWGLACLLFPIAQLAYGIVHWERAGKPFMLMIFGSITYLILQ